MPQVDANGLRIEVEEHGDPAHPPVLLVMGLATQLIHWPPDFVDRLVDAGYRVIRFDNRDIGLSEKLERLSAPKATLSMMSGMLGLGWLFAPYNLGDMADDTAGVLDALDIESAHVVGISMGGMIAQILAAKYPQRIASLTTIMSSTNNRSLPRADSSVLRAIITARSQDVSRDELVERTFGLWQMISTPDGGSDPDYIRDLIRRANERCSYPPGVRRQIAAIVASGDLRKWSRRIKAPTFVVHGTADPLTAWQGSKDIAANVPGARLELIEGMAHDLPPKLLPQVAGAIIDHLKEAAQADPASRAA